MRYETLGTKLIRWLIIWGVLLAVLIVASLITHWGVFTSWLGGVGAHIGDILMQIFIWGVLIAMLIGMVRGH